MCADRVAPISAEKIKCLNDAWAIFSNPKNPKYHEAMDSFTRTVCLMWPNILASIERRDAELLKAKKDAAEGWEAFKLLRTKIARDVYANLTGEVVAKSFTEDSGKSENI